MDDVVIEVQDLNRIYMMGEVQVHAVRGVSFSIRRGELLAIMGPSGSGKSTMMNTLGCLDRPTSGRYLLDGVDVSGLSKDDLAAIRNQKIGFVFQGFNLLSRTSAVENVELPLMYGAPLSASQRHERALECLRLVGLDHRADHVPAQLSGGEQQRVAIARALVNRPSLILADEPTGNLDTARSIEILGLFQSLNQERGITIVLVTHELDIAQHCRRVLRFRDGLLVADEAVAMIEVTGPPGRNVLIVRILMIVRVACRALGRNKARTMLTMLGIVIGVAAVIAMVALGQGAQAAVQRAIASLGTNAITLYPGVVNQGGVRGVTGTVLNLKEADSKAIVRECPSVRYVSPIVTRQFQVVNGQQNWYTHIKGVSADYFSVRNWPVRSGTPFSDVQQQGGVYVCDLGATVKKNLFPDDDPVGRYVRIRGVQFRVVGVLGAKGQTPWGDDADDVILTPYTTMMKHLARTDRVDYLYMAAVSAGRVSMACDEIDSLMRQRHHIREGASADFVVDTQKESAETAAQSSQVFTMLLGGVASVSLVVGGIGIMNIMLVSVTERIREIGTRMAVGARQTDILAQFFVEALVISLLGGLVGIGLGVGVANLADRYWQPTIVSAHSIVLAFSCSAVVGVFFGFYPGLEGFPTRSHPGLAPRVGFLCWIGALSGMQLAAFHARSLELVSDGVYGMDLDGRIVFANAAAGLVTGHPTTEWAGRDAHDLLHHSHADGTPWPATECPLRDLLLHGTDGSALTEAYWRKDGQLFNVELRSQPVHDADGRLLGAVVTFRDVSEVYAIERMKDEFISIISHELRTPLTSMRGSLGLLSSGLMGNVNDKAARMLNIAVSNTDRLITLINSIVDLQRISVGKAVLHLTPCSVGELLARAVESVRSLAEAGKIQVALEADSVERDLMADADRIVQTLVHLLGNAIKFSSPGSVVRLKAEEKRGKLCLSVTDHGRGIPHDRLAQIFERFHQVDASDSRDQGGTGLGLAICQAIVLQHGGHIWAESKVGEGSTFFITLPWRRRSVTTPTAI